MKPLIEFLICGTIGAHCVMRCAALMPRVIAEAHAVVRQATERRREIEEWQEEPLR
jgi:hypothetical protein